MDAVGISLASLVRDCRPEDRLSVVELLCGRCLLSRMMQHSIIPTSLRDVLDFRNAERCAVHLREDVVFRHSDYLSMLWLQRMALVATNGIGGGRWQRGLGQQGCSMPFWSHRGEAGMVASRRSRNGRVAQKQEWSRRAEAGMVASRSCRHCASFPEPASHRVDRAAACRQDTRPGGERSPSLRAGGEVGSRDLRRWGTCLNCAWMLPASASRGGPTPSFRRLHVAIDFFSQRLLHVSYLLACLLASRTGPGPATPTVSEDRSGLTHAHAGARLVLNSRGR